MTIDTTDRHPSTAHVAQFFNSAHLPQHLQYVSDACGELAADMIDLLPDGPELTVGLRKLLEAKDAFVRTAVAAFPPQADAQPETCARCDAERAVALWDAEVPQRTGFGWQCTTAEYADRLVLLDVVRDAGECTCSEPDHDPEPEAPQEPTPCGQCAVCTALAPAVAVLRLDTTGVDAETVARTLHELRHQGQYAGARVQ